MPDLTICWTDTNRDRETMRAFAAIIKLTVRNAVRSHIFQILALLLAICVLSIPFSVSGDGTAGGFLQLALLYSLSAVSVILSLSSLWLGCFVMTQDVESCQLHMVIAKPVSRITVWLGKFCGVLAVNTLLLAVSAVMIFFAVGWSLDRQDFPAEEKEKIKNEVMVGRRVFFPDRPDYDALAREELEKRVRQTELDGGTENVNRDELFKAIRRELEAKDAGVPFGKPRQWVFSGLPSDLKQPLYLRYRAYIQSASGSQRMTRGMWYAGKAGSEPDAAGNDTAGKPQDKSAYQVYMYQLTHEPEQIKSGDFYEKTLSPEWELVTPDGKLFCAYVNMDERQTAQYFQSGDGPKLMLKITGFAGNYFRAVLVVFLSLTVLTGLGCAAAGVLSMPTAVFTVFSYLLLGSFASYLAENSYFDSGMDYIGHYLGKFLLTVVIPLQKFEVTGMVAHGELIEFSLIWQLVMTYVVLRALPFFALGIFWYRRREMGLVIRK